MTRGSVLLALWMVKARLSQTALAADLDCSQSVVAHYLRGEYTPARHRANQFAEITHGKVPAAAWDVIATAAELHQHADAMASLRRAGHGHGWASRRLSPLERQNVEATFARRVAPPLDTRQRKARSGKGAARIGGPKARKGRAA